MNERAPPAWWPHRAASEFVTVRDLRWHVQRWACSDAQAPVALLLHGTGASTHSWRTLAPLLAQDFHIVAPDLPGHGFTQTPALQALSLPAVADGLAQLLRALALRPSLIVGHSAGAAIALRLAQEPSLRPALLVSLNGAILPPQGPAGRWFLPVARLLAAHDLVPAAFAAWSRLPTAPQRMLSGTGSRIDELGERCYGHLMQDPLHVAGALRLMASWDLRSLQPVVDQMDTRLLLVAGTNDRMVPAQQARLLAGRARHAELVVLPGLGHLAHEEDASAVVAALLGAWRKEHRSMAPGRSMSRHDPRADGQTVGV